MKSDAIFEKIKGRLEKIDPSKREVLHVYKLNITVGGKVAKSWSKWFMDSSVKIMD